MPIRHLIVSTNFLHQKLEVIRFSLIIMIIMHHIGSKSAKARDSNEREKCCDAIIIMTRLCQGNYSWDTANYTKIFKYLSPESPQNIGN